MDGEGFNVPNPRVQRSDVEQVLRELERLRSDNKRLRGALVQVRRGLITHDHRRVVDQALGRRTLGRRA